MVRFGLFANVLAIGALIVVTPSSYAQPASPAPVAQQQSDAQAHHPAAEQAPGAKAQGAPMMAMQQKMMADMKAADAALDALVTKMTTVEGAAKVDAIAELLARGHDADARPDDDADGRGTRAGESMTSGQK